MTRSCIHCTRFIAEECIRCGTEATPLKTISNGHAMTGTEFHCSACGHHFTQGEGGETGGICEPCFISELRSAQERRHESKISAKGE